MGQAESVADGGRVIGHMKMEEREVEEEERRGKEERERRERSGRVVEKEERGQGDCLTD